MGKFELLDEDIAREIETFKDKKWKDEGLEGLFPNVIHRSDVLKVLSRYCTVVYYPLNDEENNGFHIKDIPDAKGRNQHFVYINTAQSVEKQIFTAAHELGHCWDVETHVLAKFDKDRINEIRQHGEKNGLECLEERIVNRFAAELLMPADVFKVQYKRISDDSNISDKAIPLFKFLRIVAYLMNYFLVPVKSVFIRMAELNILSVDTVNKLTEGGNNTFFAIINREIERISREEGYTDLYNIVEKKYIDGLSEILEKAEKYQTVSVEKINNLRKLFDLKSDTEAPELNEKIDLE